jgi:hypothetical protein
MAEDGGGGRCGREPVGAVRRPRVGREELTTGVWPHRLLDVELERELSPCGQSRVIVLISLVPLANLSRSGETRDAVERPPVLRNLSTATPRGGTELAPDSRIECAPVGLVERRPVRSRFRGREGAS